MKMYVVVRSDLSAGMQIAQSCHALRLFADEHPESDRTWYEQSNNLVVLSVSSKEDLAKLAYDMTNLGIEVSSFREPDLQNDLTAIAIEPAGGRHLSKLPLAMKDVLICRRAA